MKPYCAHAALSHPAAASRPSAPRTFPWPLTTGFWQAQTDAYVPPAPKHLNLCLHPCSWRQQLRTCTLRTLVSFFSLQGFTSMSSSLLQVLRGRVLQGVAGLCKVLHYVAVSRWALQSYLLFSPMIMPL